MSRCTAPVHGHRTASGAANCPACGGSSRYRTYSYAPKYPVYSNNTSNSSKPTSNRKSESKAPWASRNSTNLYSPGQLRTLAPVRENVVKRSDIPDLRDVFLCHAWDDRKGAALQLHNILESNGVSVWFSEKDVGLGSSLLREIDKGLAKSRVGIVLVTPSFLSRVRGEGIADKELSALLARDLLIPIIHDTTFEALREVSPLLGSRSGLSTEEESMDKIASKLSELVTIE